MAVLKIYLYNNCGTCRKAVKWLTARGIEFHKHPIRETPPSVEELRLALRTEDNIRKIINTSSQDYREAGLKDKLGELDPEEVFAILRANGNLVKRPFIVYQDQAWAGFKETVWEERLT